MKATLRRHGLRVKVENVLLTLFDIVESLDCLIPYGRPHIFFCELGHQDRGRLCWRTEAQIWAIYMGDSLL